MERFSRPARAWRGSRVARDGRRAGAVLHAPCGGGLSSALPRSRRRDPRGGVRAVFRAGPPVGLPNRRDKPLRDLVPQQRRRHRRGSARRGARPAAPAASLSGNSSRPRRIRPRRAAPIRNAVLRGHWLRARELLAAARRPQPGTDLQRNESRGAGPVRRDPGGGRRGVAGWHAGYCGGTGIPRDGPSVSWLGVARERTAAALHGGVAALPSMARLRDPRPAPRGPVQRVRDARHNCVGRDLRGARGTRRDVDVRGASRRRPVVHIGLQLPAVSGALPRRAAAPHGSLPPVV